MAKTPLGFNVHDGATNRIAWVFDTFPRIYVSFSGGKDSSVMLHLVMDEALKRNRKVGVLFVDLEGQYKLTIEHIQAMYDRYAEHVEPYWVALPIHLRNAVSAYEPHWICWDKAAEESWVRQTRNLRRAGRFQAGDAYAKRFYAMTTGARGYPSRNTNRRLTRNTRQ